jgi:uncharacterized protein YbjT (DUF2867 family)
MGDRATHSSTRHPGHVLRPVMFMEYHADPTYGVYGQAAHIRAIPPDERVQLIALSDIGAFAALAFAEPRRFVDRAIELAGAELSLHQLLSAIIRATGRDVAAVAGRTPPDPSTAESEFAAMTSSSAAGAQTSPPCAGCTPRCLTSTRG